MDYWATGITTTYLEGALERALALLPEARLARRAQQAGRQRSWREKRQRVSADAPDRVVDLLDGELYVSDPYPTYAWLREHFHPVGHIAYAYLIFDVSELDLQRALAEYGR